MQWTSEWGRYAYWDQYSNDVIQMVSEEENGKENGSWLEEHDTIQMELLKMKDDLLKESKDPEPIVTDKTEEAKMNKKMASLIPGMEEPEPVIEEPIKEKPSIPFPPIMEKQEQKVTNDEDRNSKNDPTPGKIPTSPHLTNKIAKVMQLENKLKRRKFEMEKEEQRKNKKVKDREVEEEDDVAPSHPKEKEDHREPEPKLKKVDLPPPPPIEPVLIEVEVEENKEEIELEVIEEEVDPDPPVEPEPLPVVEKEKTRANKEVQEKDKSHLLKKKRKVTRPSRKDTMPDLYHGTSLMEEIEDDDNDIEVLEPLDEPEKKKGPMSRLSNLFKRRRKQ